MRPVVFVVPLSLLPERMLACPVQVFVTWTARPVPHQAHSPNTTVAITLGRPQNHITPRPLAWRDLLFTAHNANIHHKKGTQWHGDHKHIVHTTQGGNTTEPYLRKSQEWMNR